MQRSGDVSLRARVRVSVPEPQTNTKDVLIGLPSGGGNQVAATDYRKEQEIW